MTKFSFNVFVIFAFTAIVSAVDLPEYLQVCKRNDPNLNDCIKRSVDHLRPYLATGVPEYNLPTLEPLLLKEIVLTEGNGGIKIVGRDIKAYGSSDFTVTSMKADMNNFVFILDIVLPHIYVDGQYDVDGRILLLPITGSGRIRGNFTDCTGAVRFSATLTTEGTGIEHFNVNEFSLKVTVGKGSIQLENLFGGDKTVGDVINTAINANFNAILRELKPSVEKALGDTFWKIGNIIVEQFSYDQLFPVD